MLHVSKPNQVKIAKYVKYKEAEKQEKAGKF